MFDQVSYCSNKYYLSLLFAAFVTITVTAEPLVCQLVALGYGVIKGYLGFAGSSCMIMCLLVIVVVIFVR